MVIANTKFFTVTNDLMVDENKHYISIWMQADWKSGTPTVTEPDKFTDLQWLTFQTLPSPLFEPYWQNLKIAMPHLFAS